MVPNQRLAPSFPLHMESDSTAFKHTLMAGCKTPAGVGANLERKKFFFLFLVGFFFSYLHFCVVDFRTLFKGREFHTLKGENSAHYLKGERSRVLFKGKEILNIV